MGATGWRYILPYRELVDVVAAEQQRIHREVDFQVPPTLTAHEVAHMDVMEILEASEGSGTHSLLDLQRVGPWEQLQGVVAEVPEQLIERFAGTPAPANDPETIDRICEAAWSHLSRWSAVALPLHDDRGAPDAWLVVGVTGD